MKKLVLSLILVLVVATGCSGVLSKNKTLECIQDDHDENMNTAIKSVVEFDGDKVKAVEMEAKMEFLGEEAETSATFMNSLFAAVIEEFNALEGVEAAVDLEDGVFTYSISIDYTKISDEALETLDMDLDIDTDATIDSIKAEAEADGATCTIK